MSPEKMHILYVDDEPINLKLFRFTFQKEFEIHTATSAKIALEVLEEDKDNIKVVITDYMMPEKNGVELLKEINETYSDKTFGKLIISGFSKTDDIEEAYDKLGLHKFISKPWEKEDVCKAIYESIGASNKNIKS